MMYSSGIYEHEDSTLLEASVAKLDAICRKLDLQPEDHVLEIGTGSGYQTAILAEIAKSVFSVEILPPLSYEAQDLLNTLGYSNVHYKVGDGFDGWTAFMPFDAILIACASPTIPEPLIAQLREGGRLVMPLGSYDQALMRITIVNGQPKFQKLMDVAFVPMTGRAQMRR